MSAITVPVPKEFSFDEALTFLKRSPRELLHRVENETVSKAIRVGNTTAAFTVTFEKNKLHVRLLTDGLTPGQQYEVVAYIREWFDLDTDLKPFYALADKDKLLKDLVKQHYGYRIVGQPDLYESLTWAMLGQQINVAFAYTLKQHFVENFGATLQHGDQKYFLFPEPATVAVLTTDQLLPLQFSRQKATYAVTIAEAFANGNVSKESLQGLPLQEAKERLIKIKGVGNWTANYALMKTFRYPDAFPLEDAGLYNVVKKYKKLDRKPTADEMKKVFKKYKGWEAYATLYLWKSA
ncbi:DNA-3-methyladenine glycosylase family protein [Chryseolinea lacunae]|uniref:DNA-3-methyladenine glycosylase II n=1 Tax=Chryseolinea lacunae TaxID=2801331 RepID=A0ABS1KSP7_9BACT|nr:DNA-3-methyladenine glycosylase 2 [Chryseolinea lacunae]MBL0742503.1 DNA-3-methyladenine glycosylase 2 [Chryseolinea lacunae]